MNAQQNNNASLLQRYGKLAIVTGASSGIGDAFARLLVQQGFDLLLVARREDRLQKLQAELASHDAQVDYLALDLAAPSAITEIATALEPRQQDLGLIVSNAGFGLKGGFNSNELAEIQQMLAVNTQAPIALLYALLPGLRARGKGGVILTGSQEGESPYPWSAAYAATKAFVHSFGQSLYGELNGTGVDLLVLAPGATDTEAGPLQGIDMSEMPGLMSPKDVAQQALDNLGKRPVFTPGWQNRLMIGVFKLMPRRLRIAVAGKAMAAALKDNGHDVHG